MRWAQACAKYKLDIGFTDSLVCLLARLRRSPPTAKVYDIVRLIPHGRVTTYGHIAKLAGSPRHSRMVGAALRFLQDESVPWQRVISSSGAISERGDGGEGARRQADRLRDGEHCCCVAASRFDPILLRTACIFAETGPHLKCPPPLPWDWNSCFFFLFFFPQRESKSGSRWEQVSVRTTGLEVPFACRWQRTAGVSRSKEPAGRPCRISTASMLTIHTNTFVPVACPPSPTLHSPGHGRPRRRRRRGRMKPYHYIAIFHHTSQCLKKGSKKMLQES